MEGEYKTYTDSENVRKKDRNGKGTYTVRKLTQKEDIVFFLEPHTCIGNTVFFEAPAALGIAFFIKHQQARLDTVTV